MGDVVDKELVIDLSKEEIDEFAGLYDQVRAIRCGEDARLASDFDTHIKAVLSDLGMVMTSSKISKAMRNAYQLLAQNKMIDISFLKITEHLFKD